MTLSLDTATLIDLIRGRSASVRDNYRRAVQAGDDFAISAVVMHELISGAVTSHAPHVERARMDETLVGLPIAELTAEDVEDSGRLAGELRRRGRQIGDLDVLIAGQALARGWTVVTSNVRHFGRVDGLPLIDWQVGPGRLAPSDIVRRFTEAQA